MDVVYHQARGADSPAEQPALFVVARRLFAAGVRVTGLAPVGPGIEVGALLGGLAAALARISGAEVGVVTRRDPGPGAPPPRGEAVQALTSLEPARDGVVAITVLAKADPFLTGRALERATTEFHDRIPRFLLDLTGVFPEDTSCLARMGGVALCARAGLVTERELLAAGACLPEGRALGVLLVGR